MGEWFQPLSIMTLPPGAFITLGVVIGLFRAVENKSLSLTRFFGNSSLNAAKEEKGI